MGYIEGLLGGFMGARDQHRAEELDLAKTQNEHESRVFSALLNSDDPHVQSMAAAGLLTSASGPKRAGGIRGWVGDMQQNPLTGQIRDYITQGVQVPHQVQVPTGEPAALPSRAISGMVTDRPEPSLAQPSTQTTTPGTAGPRAVLPDVTMHEGPLSHPTAPTRTATVMNTEPRHIFPTIEEQAVSKYRGEYQGQVEGIAAGLVASDPRGPTPEAKADALKVARAHFMRSQGLGASGGLTPMTGRDATGKVVQGMFDHRVDSPTYGKYIDSDGAEIPGFVHQSITTPRATDREGGAQELFHKHFADLDDVEAKAVNDWMVQFQGRKAGATATGRQTALAAAPLTREEAVTQTRDFTEQWNRNTAPIRVAQQAQARMHAALSRLATDPNGAAQGIIDAFEKITNPQSGVGATEFAQSAQGQTLVDRATALLQKYGTTGGQGVTAENLQELVTTADALVSALGPWQQTFRTQIENQARTAGITDTGPIFGEPSSQVGVSPAAAVGPAPVAPTTAAPVSPRVGTSPTGRGSAPASGGGVDDYTTELVNGKWVVKKKSGGSPPPPQ